MTSASSLSLTLHMFLLPDDELDIPVTHSTRAQLAHCVRQMKRMGYRFNGVIRPLRELDCVAAAMVRRRNVVRRNPITRPWDPACDLTELGAQLTETNWLATVPVSWANSQLNQSTVSLMLTPYCLVSVTVGSPISIQSLIGFNPLS